MQPRCTVHCTVCGLGTFRQLKSVSSVVEGFAFLDGAEGDAGCNLKVSRMPD